MGTRGFRRSWALKNLFGEIRNGSLVIDNQMIDVLLSANDFLKQMIMDVENSEMEDISEHTARIAKALNSKSGGQRSDSSPGPATANNYEGFFSADIDTEEIREAARRGQRFYKIKIAPGDNPPEMLKKIESIGSIAGSSGSAGTPGPGDAFDLLVVTVLESNLISLALDIAEENITPL